MLSGFLSLLGTVLISRAIFRQTEGELRLTLSLGSAPMVLAATLYLILLIFPGISPSTTRFVMAGGLIAGAALCLTLNRQFNLPPSDFYLLIPLAASLPAFFFVTQAASSFDPINYAFIGKTFLTEMSVRGYPFISVNYTGGVFSWFAHPPMFSLMQTWLELVGFDTLVRYIGPFYYALVNILVFQAVRKRVGLAVAISTVLVLAVTPFFVRASVEGFTTPVRMFFFAGTAVLLSLPEEKRVWPAAIFAGMAMLTHSIGLLAVPGGILALILLDRRWNWKKLFIFGFIACFTGSLPYLVNFWKFHSLTTVGIFVHAFGKNLIDDVFQYQFVQREMATATARLVYGYFSPIFRFSSYGLAFILGFTGLMAAGFRWKSRDRLVTAALGFLIVYFTMHFLPIHHNIFILSPRYPLTVLPLLIIAGAVSLPQWRLSNWVATGIALIALGLTLFFASPFHRQPCLQCEMAQYINAHLTPEDHVLVSRSPFFFLNIQNVPGTDAMEPGLAPLYSEPDLNRILQRLKEMKITHILLPYAPTPFESKGFVRRMVETPGILEGIKHTPAFHLFRVHYPEIPLKEPEQVKLLSWHPDLSDLTLTAYDNSGKQHSLRFWYSRAGLHIFTPFSNTRLALARDIPWRKNAPYISTKACKSVTVSMRFQNSVAPFRLYWDFYQFDQDGNMLGVTHPRPVIVTPGWKSLVMPTAYPRMLSSRLPLDSRTVKIALSFSFYSEPGGTCVNAIDITGYR